jgi:hypothetical protein
MTRPRLTIAQMMTLILLVGIGFAALRNANQFWASATYAIAIISILAALLGASAPKGKARMTWAGFAVFGLTYLFLDLLADLSVSLGTGPIRWPSLIIDMGAELLQPRIFPSAGGTYDLVQYFLVSHSLGIILLGLLGAVIGRFVASGGNQPDPLSF